MLDFFGRFQVRSGMMVESYLQIQTSAPRDNPMDRILGRLPLVGGPGKPVRLLAASGDSGSRRTDFVGKDQQVAIEIVKQPGGSLNMLEAGGVRRPVAEVHSDESRAQRKLAAFKFGAQHCRIGRQKAVRPEFGACIACLRDLIEHP